MRKNGREAASRQTGPDFRAALRLRLLQTLDIHSRSFPDTYTATDVDTMRRRAGFQWNT